MRYVPISSVPPFHVAITKIAPTGYLNIVNFNSLYTVRIAL